MIRGHLNYFSSMSCVIFLWLLSRFPHYLWLSASCLTMMWLRMVFFVLILCGILRASGICMLDFYQISQILVIIASDIFYALLPSGITSTHMLNLLTLSHRSLAVIIFGLCFSDWIISIALSSSSLILYHLYLISLSVKCLIWDTVFSVVELSFNIF